jgi:hypothetical protein
MNTSLNPLTNRGVSTLASRVLLDIIKYAEVVKLMRDMLDRRGVRRLERGREFEKGSTRSVVYVYDVGSRY